MLIVFGGLPAVGKTTLSRVIAQELGATWLRIDAIEAAMWQAGVTKSQPTGLAAYVVAHAIATAQLQSWNPVVVDAVNPVDEARAGWRDLAAEQEVPVHFVEVVCSDPVEHRRRVESREPDLPGWAVPTWEEVAGRDYRPWSEPRLTVDTALVPPEECLKRIRHSIA